jgi:carbon-monoxide dehydrogenase large subunit
MRDNADIPEELGGVLSSTADVQSTVASFPYRAHACEVEIDIQTGQVFIARYIAVDDVGRAVNPMILDGQTHGAIAQGIGEALMEECSFDDAGPNLSVGFPRSIASNPSITSQTVSASGARTRQ